MSSPEILLRNDITDIAPWEINARGIKLLGVDVENVLTDYGNPEVRPEAAAALDNLQNWCGLTAVLVTNNRNDVPEYSDQGFVDEVQSQVGNIPAYHQSESLNGKTSPAIFRLAASDAGVNPENAALIDDQFKSYKGLWQASWGLFIWTKPYGEHQHTGVKMGRLLEAPLRKAISVSHVVSDIYRSGL